MSVLLRRAASRPVTRTGWLESRHSFSFGQHHDPAWMGFGALRVLNDDVVVGGAGFAPHRHANMEIVSVVLEGALAHRDSTGAHGVIAAGEVQVMSAGHGIEHSEFNANANHSVHFLQVWIQPDRVNAAPAHSQSKPAPVASGQWQRLVGEGALEIRQDAFIECVTLDAGQAASFAVRPGMGCWLQVLEGEVVCSALQTELLVRGDGLGVVEASPCQLACRAAARVLRIDTPM